MLFFRKLFSIFTPPPPVTQLHLSVIDKEYKKHRKMIFMGIFLGYAASYLVRKNFSLAMPHLIKEGFTKGQLGLVLTVMAVSYGLSKFLMGNVSDRSNPKYFLAAGLIVSTAVAFIFGFAGWAYCSIAVIFVLMFINGWAQGMTYPPCVAGSRQF